MGVTDGSRFIYPMTRKIGHDSSALNTWPFIDRVNRSWSKTNKNMLGVFGERLDATLRAFAHVPVLIAWPAHLPDCFGHP